MSDILQKIKDIFQLSELSDEDSRKLITLVSGSVDLGNRWLDQLIELREVSIPTTTTTTTTPKPEVETPAFSVLVDEGLQRMEEWVNSGRIKTELYDSECWVKGIDLSAIGTGGSGLFGSGILVGKKHCIAAAHDYIPLGSSISFTSASGSMETKNVVSINVHPNYETESFSGDLQVLELDSPVSDKIEPMRILQREPLRENQQPYYALPYYYITKLPVLITGPDNTIFPMCGHSYSRVQTSGVQYEYYKIIVTSGLRLGLDVRTMFQLRGYINPSRGTHPMMVLHHGKLCLLSIGSGVNCGASIPDEFDMIKSMGVDDLTWG